MRSSILIAFLVVAISSSTFGVGSIFGITIDPDKLHTLNGSRVEEEIQAKLGLVQKIEELIEKVPTNESAWLDEFKKMVTAEREMIEKLKMPLSEINTDNLQRISERNSSCNIPDGVFQKIHEKLDNYSCLLKTFDFSRTVWENRLFLGNPFQQFLDRITGANLEGSKVTKLQAVFKEAAAEVDTAKKAIDKIMKGFAKAFVSQNEQSKKVMDEFHRLNKLVGSGDDKNVKKSTENLDKLLKKLLIKLSNVKPIRGEISKHLRKIDIAHIDLNNRLRQI